MKILRGILKSLPSLVLGSLLIVLIFNKQSVYDWYALRGYRPDDTIRGLSLKSDMSKKAERIFFVHKPSLLDKSTFNSKCPINEETIVLGCYDGRGIYILDVNDPRLSGIEEVTAAHEMLHAAYARLSEVERIAVNKLIETELKNLTDARVLKNIQTYRDKDPSIVINEAHSILATEVADISPELESYYSQYFNNRRAVVNLSDAYESVFTNIKNEVENLDNQLAEKRELILTKETELTSQAEVIMNWSSELDRLKQTNKINEYNSQVYDYNSTVEKYRNDVAYVKKLIQEYNSTIELRNKLANQQSDLYKSIDSKVKDL